MAPIWIARAKCRLKLYLKPDGMPLALTQVVTGCIDELGGMGRLQQLRFHGMDPRDFARRFAPAPPEDDEGR